VEDAHDQRGVLRAEEPPGGVVAARSPRAESPRIVPGPGCADHPLDTLRHGCAMAARYDWRAVPRDRTRPDGSVRRKPNRDPPYGAKEPREQRGRRGGKAVKASPAPQRFRPPGPLHDL
jgi:hypothetical protein